MAYNNEKEGIIECLKKDVGVVDLDSGVSSLPDWISTKAVLTTWLADALAFELWIGCESSSAHSIYYSDLPWPMGRILSQQKARSVKLKLGITDDNAQVKMKEIYGRASSAYEALSNCLGEQNYLFENRPSSLDAIFLAHGLIVLQALPESSMMRINFLEHPNLVRYVEHCKTEIIEADTSPSSGPHFHTNASSSASRSQSTKSSKPKSKPKREKTKEEKSYKRRSTYFVVAQLVTIVVFLTLMTTYDDGVEADEAGYDYDE